MRRTYQFATLGRACALTTAPNSLLGLFFEKLHIEGQATARRVRDKEKQRDRHDAIHTTALNHVALAGLRLLTLI